VYMHRILPAIVLFYPKGLPKLMDFIV